MLEDGHHGTPNVRTVHEILCSLALACHNEGSTGDRFSGKVI
jgi:hypothetical protein